MGMGVDKAGQKHVIRTLVESVGLEAHSRFGTGKKGDNSALIDRDGKIFLCGAIRFYCDCPARANQCIDALAHSKWLSYEGLARRLLNAEY
jgi:hypothetical protein